jgi:hypothetical protein
MKEVDASTALLGPVPLPWVSGPFIVDGKLHASGTNDHIKAEKKYLVLEGCDDCGDCANSTCRVASVS